MLETKSSFMGFQEGKMNTTSLVEIQVIFWNSCVLKHQAADSKQYGKSAGKGINSEPKVLILSQATNCEAFQGSKPSRDTSAHTNKSPSQALSDFPFPHLKGGEERKKINTK